MLVMLMSALDRTIFSTALPTVVGELHGSSHMTWGALALVVGIAALKMPPQRSKVTLDYLGITTMTCAVACTVLLAQRARTKYAWSDPLIIALLVATFTTWALRIVTNTAQANRSCR